MALPPLPPNQTATYFVDYTFNGESRSTQFRHGSGVTLGSLIPAVQTFLNALGQRMCTSWQVTGARYRAQGAVITLPVEAPVTPTVTGGTLAPEKNPRFVAWIGRGSTSGRKVRVSVYGLTFTEQADYRLDVADVAQFDTARTALDAAATGLVTTIAGDDPLWYLYYNFGFNSYHERAARQ